MLSLLTRTKSFRDPWVGHPTLNRRWLLHRRRMQAAELLCRWRRWLKPAQLQDLERDGFTVIENVLPTARFAALREEVERAVASAAHRSPPPRNDRTGFQPKQPFPGGFDRYDGGTTQALGLLASGSKKSSRFRRNFDRKQTHFARKHFSQPNASGGEIYRTGQSVDRGFELRSGARKNRSQSASVRS